MYPLMSAIICTVFGAIFGSFSNVVIWRVPNNLSLIPRSHCPKCGALITWWQNIPIVSWILLRGRCYNCHERISIRYPIVEALGAISWGVAGWVFAPSDVSSVFTLLVVLAFSTFGLQLAFIDIDTKRLPNVLTYPLLAVTTVLVVAAGVSAHQWDALIRSGVTFLVLVTVFFLLAMVGGGMGMGDVKLVGSLGVLTGFLGVSQSIVSILSAFVLAAIVGVVMMLTQGATRKTAIPFGPYLVVGTWIGLLAGVPLWGAYLSLMTMTS